MNKSKLGFKISAERNRNQSGSTKFSRRQTVLIFVEIGHGAEVLFVLLAARRP
jgi:hypothetical protein